MNRRSFIADMLKAGVACTFLPGAGRIWKPTYQSEGLVRFFVPKPQRLDLDHYFQLFYKVRLARERMAAEEARQRYAEVTKLGEAFFFS